MSAGSPYPPPLPLAPLAYSPPPPASGRPGILTAVGVISIIVACLSGMGSLSGLMMSFGFAMMGSIRMTPPPTAIASPAIAAPNAGAVPTGGLVTIGGIPANEDDGTDGLPTAQRRLATDLLSRMGSLDQPRENHLDLLLAVAGKKMFPSVGGPLTTRRIRQNISDFGQIPSPAGGNSTVFFVIGTGRIEIYDDHALFRPDGSSDVVTASAPASPVASPPPPAAGPTPAFSQSSYSSINSSGGRTTITTTVNGRSSTTTFSTAPTMPFKISTGAVGLSLIEALLSGLLAVFLLVAGIMVLRNSLNGGKLHWIYVLIKIPLVIISIVATWWLWSDLFGSMFASMPTPPGAAAPPNIAPLMMIWGVVFGLIALIYPVALIFVLSSRTVREYYHSVRTM